MNFPFSLDIRAGVQMGVGLAALLAVLSLVSGIRAIQHGRNLRYFRMRHERMVQGWRRIFAALLLGAAALALNTYAEPLAYSFFPPSVTPTITPSITQTPTTSLTPSITLSPTVTNTPSESNTPTTTATPHIPLPIEGQFSGTLTPPANAVFSALSFTNQGLDENNIPINPTEVFTNPVGSMFAAFSFDGMATGVQWTALWYRGDELVNFETLPWDGSTGGYGFSEWHPLAEEWLPGEYQVQLFLGYDWYQVGFFTVAGDPPNPTATVSPTASSTPTATASPSQTPTASVTLTPSRTPSPSLPPGTIAPTITITPRNTYPPTLTLSPTLTRQPRATPIPPTPTITRWPTLTPTPAP